ncbi:alpha/beta hydrolase family protein [Myxococcus xanthus]|uniref:alpha/beta hydrolase family protein n=1 Tax=Myxococcus xanthus TaxID=34 RepID=UPI001F294D4A|nr:alpha/beta fold hydrolase [Myxococcus xanthus]
MFHDIRGTLKKLTLGACLGAVALTGAACASSPGRGGPEPIHVEATAPRSEAVAGASVTPDGRPPYVNGAAFRGEEVTVGQEPFLLKGTLTVPVGKGPFPGVVLVHGSGPHDRDVRFGPNALFKDLAEGLSSRGIAVLRYDKRTFQYKEPFASGISIDDEVVVDAVSAMGVLKARPEVDAARVFVVGHSLGALLAPEIALRSAPVAGAVLLAPPGRPMWELIPAQLRYLGAPAERIAEVEKAAEPLKARTASSGSFLGLPLSYWNDLDSRDGVGMARKLQRPILIMQGERDYQSTEEDLATWRRGLAQVDRVDVVRIPGSNHMFIHGEGRSGPAEYMIPGHVDARVVERLCSFLLSARE